MTAPELTRAGQGRPAIGRSPRRQALRTAAMLAVPTIAYFAARPWASSDAVALAIGGAVPLGYQVAVRRRVDAWALDPASASHWPVWSRCWPVAARCRSRRTRRR